MDNVPNTKGESIRISSEIKNKIKNGNEEGYKKLIEKQKNMKPQ